MLKMFLPPSRHVPSALKAVTEGRCPPVLQPLSSAVFPTEAATFPGCQGGQGPPSLIAEAMWGPHTIDTNTSERYNRDQNAEVISHACAVLLPSLTLIIWEQGYISQPSVAT